jgi:hypothetical protein
MINRTVSRASRAIIVALALGLCVPAGRAQAPAAGASATGVMPLDLTTGKTDATPLEATSPNSNEAFDPRTPPQTVEGTLVSVDPSGQFATIRTQRHGDVKIGLPPDAYVSRTGDEAGIGDMKPGDRVWATVETAHGVRAIRIVFAPPFNPLISWIGIPLLLLIAFGIWWTGRHREREDKRAAPAQA